jgi:hypothetical protein
MAFLIKMNKIDYPLAIKAIQKKIRLNRSGKK